MKLSTRVEHARIRFKHWFLRLRVHQPLYFKTLITLMLVIGIGGIVTAFLLYSNKPQAVSSNDPVDITIKEYSINGTVVDKSSNQFDIRTTVVESRNGISMVVEKVVTVTYQPSTPVSSIQLINGQINEQPANIEEITLGKILSIYSTNNPASSDAVPAVRIEILN